MEMKYFKLVMVAVFLLVGSAPSFGAVLETTMSMPKAETAREDEMIINAWAADEMVEAKAMALRERLITAARSYDQQGAANTAGLKCKASGRRCYRDGECCSGYCKYLLTPAGYEEVQLCAFV